jgi:hypothetical protein
MKNPIETRENNVIEACCKERESQQRHTRVILCCRVFYLMSAETGRLFY